MLTMNMAVEPPRHLRKPASGTGGSGVDRLFNGLFPGIGADRAASDTQLLAAMQNASRDDVLARRDLTSNQRGTLTVAGRVVGDYFSEPAFHPELSRQLLPDTDGLVALGLGTDGWLRRKNHPAIAFMRVLGELATGWSPEHPQATELAGQMQGWLRKLTDQVPVEQVLDDARQWQAGFRRRIDKLEQRLKESESGRMKLDYARRQAARVLARQLAGRELPRVIAKDLEEHWWPALQWILLNKGEQHPLWQQTVRSLTLLFWAMQPEAASQHQDKFKRVSGDLQHQLPELLGEILPDESVREQIMETLHMALLSLRQGHDLEYTSPPMLDDATLLDHTDTTVSRDLLEEISNLSLEDWFQVKASDQRVRLLIRQDDYQQLLFVNQAGLKAMTFSFEEFAWKLASREVVPVPLPMAPGELVLEHLEGLAEHYRRRKQQAKRQRREAEGAAEKAATAEQEQKAADAATPEPVADVAAPEQPDQPQTPEPVPEDAGARKRARLLVSGLPLGSWLDFSDDGGVSRLKLVLVLSSSNKYVFVSRSGQDRREVKRDDLIQGIARGDISVLNNDSRYDDTLSRVVNGLQKENARA
jgi:hypothetical protein